MIAGPRAERVEAPEGAFPSLTAAAKHFGYHASGASAA